MMSVFLVGVGLFFWIFPGNILESGLAQMDALFEFAPWFFLLLIPSLTMRSFSEEFKTGTIEFISTKPITDWQIILGKYLASVALVAFTLLPTFVYFLTIYINAAPLGNVDTGGIMGAYLGLMGIGAVFAAIGIFASTLTESQIVAYVLGAFLCFFFFSAFDFLAELPALASFNTIIIQLGIFEHYRSISRGVVDSRDVIYYLTLITVFLLYSKAVLTSKKK
jgi:ABC-2 type transport system permease protein